jgi:hypothetical protein
VAAIELPAAAADAVGERAAATSGWVPIVWSAAVSGSRAAAAAATASAAAARFLAASASRQRCSHKPGVNSRCGGPKCST